MFNFGYSSIFMVHFKGFSVSCLGGSLMNIFVFVQIRQHGQFVKPRRIILELNIRTVDSNLVPRVSHLPAPLSLGREDERPWERGCVDRFRKRMNISLLVL